jgi:hypothetical protein
MDPYFWTHLVLQFSHFNPAVRHTVIAISSLYEKFVGGSRIIRLRHNFPALVHYNAAIQEIKSAQDEQLILMVCILFICVELLQGDLPAATRHCRHGIIILERLKVEPGRSLCPWVVEHLLPIFRRLSFFLFLPAGGPSIAEVQKPSSMVFLGNSVEIQCVPNRFSTIIEASNSLDQIRARCNSTLSHVQDDEAIREHRHKKTQLEESLRLWSYRVSEFESCSKDCLQSTDRLALCNLRMKYEKERICLDVDIGAKSFTTEIKYDRHLSSFRSIVDEAQRAITVMTPQAPTGLENAQRPSFSFEAGFLPLLFFVVLKCRHLETRLQALSWMPRLSAAKEGLVDLGTLYRVGRRVIEIEHSISLDDELCIHDNEGSSHILGADDIRMVAVPVDHEMEVVTEKDGTVSYQRSVYFLMRNPDETMSSRKEYLRDGNLRQFDIQIPGMRSAL